MFPEAWFRTYDKVNAPSVQLELQRRTSKERLHDWLENSRFRTNHFKCILCSLFQTLDVTKLCSTKSRCNCLQRQKSRNLNQGNEWAMLLVHLLLSSVPEIHFFENFRNAGSKCVGAPSCMNPKWILVSISTYYNISGRTFRTKSW